MVLSATHGKGSVQTLLDIGEEIGRNLGALKITTQQFYRPTGESTQNRGVMADVELPSFTAHMDVAESDLDYSLPFDRVAPVPFKRYEQVSADIIRRLNELSLGRVSEDGEFTKLARRIQKYLERKDRTHVTLNESKFLAERAEIKSDEKEVEDAVDEPRTREPSIKRDFYLDEAIEIALDYFRLLKGPKVAARVQ